VTCEIGVAFDGFDTTADAVAQAKRAVAAGARSLWVAEHLGYREAIVTCTAFAAFAPGAMLVPTAVSPYLWHPTPTAMALATLDELAPGATAVAIGAGNPLFLAESGQTLTKPLQAVRQFVEALRRLWSSEPVHLEAAMFSLAGARMMFRPRPIPIYIAAMGPEMLKLTGRIADGVVLSAGLSVQSVRRSLAVCAAAAASAGRDPMALRRAGYIFFAASPDPAEAIDAARVKLAFVLRNKFLAENVRASGIAIDQAAVVAAIARRDLAAAAALVPDEAVEAFAIAGTPEHCASRLGEFVAAGLDEPVLNILGMPANRDLALDVMRGVLGAGASTSIP
jgi:5,10-methylenetetrahydromethanopterin reductase